MDDETKINLYLSMRKQKCGEKNGTANDPKHTASSVKHGGGGVMAWACMAVSGTGSLNFTNDLMMTVTECIWKGKKPSCLPIFKKMPPDSLGSASYCIRTMTQNTLPVQSQNL